MNDVWFLAFQPALNSDVAHVLLDLFVAACASFFALCGGLGLFLVKRAVRQHDDWRKSIEARISAIENRKSS